MSKEGLDVARFQAPLLPVPKSRWSGLVYLHGLLPMYPEGENLNHLILSSGDFGLAYLTERWAVPVCRRAFPQLHQSVLSVTASTIRCCAT